MASHTIAADEVAVHDKTLTANVADTVTFAADPGEIQIVTDGAAAIYVTTDGSTPTVGGAKTRRLPATPCVRTLRHPDSGGVVKLISTGTPTYSVERA